MFMLSKAAANVLLFVFVSYSGIMVSAAPFALFVLQLLRSVAG